VLVVAAAVGVALVSGGSSADPETPKALPGLPPPFLGTALAGSGAITAAVDAYGDVVDLRLSPAGPALIDNPSDRQAAGTVPADTGIVPRLSIDGGLALMPWQADSVRQRYLPGTNVVRTELRFGAVRGRVTVAAVDESLVILASAASAVDAGGSTERTGGAETDRAAPEFDVNLADDSWLRCERTQGASTAVLICAEQVEARLDGLESDTGNRDSTVGGPSAAADSGSGGSGALTPTAARLIRSAIAADRAWLARARPLGPRAPAWARQMYARSLLTLRALTDRRTGAVGAGARDGWAYVWPRDAGTAALALAAAGYVSEARQAASFLNRLDLDAAARFDGRGRPVPGRAAQGDAAGWAAIAAHAAGLPATAPLHPAWRNRADYQEGAPGDFLANAIASTSRAPGPSPTARTPDSTSAPHVDGPQIQGGEGYEARQPGVAGLAGEFWNGRGLVRRARDPGSGLDSAAAWAVRPFPIPALYPAVETTLLRLARNQTRFGITPGEAWTGVDPWMAPTAWSAWAFAALAREESAGPKRRALSDRRQALRLLGDLRHAATPAGALPERVDAHTGIPRSTTPLAWPHAFAILALRELWPTRHDVSELTPP
jgi:hypothetical protein